MFKLPPTNRIVAFCGPYISVISGGVASWLVVNVQVFGSLHLGKDQLANGIAYAVTAGLGALIPHFGFNKWLDGHQIYFSRVFDLVKTLDPGVQSQVVAALPLVKGDLLKALGSVLPTPAGLVAGSPVPNAGEQGAPDEKTKPETAVKPDGSSSAAPSA